MSGRAHQVLTRSGRARVAGQLLAVLVLAAAPALAEDGIRKEPVQFKPGTSQASIAAHIKGDETVDYTLRAKAGQTMKAHLKATNPQAYFNVLPPGSETAIFVGSTSGDSFEGNLEADGEYTIRVYLMRAAARRNESAKYTLDVAITGGAPAAASAAPAAAAAAPTATAPAKPVDEKLELQGITFHVSSPNAASGNTVRIVPAGLASDNAPIEQPVEGFVTGVEVGDINADLSPEVYVYVRSADAAARGSLIAYSANKKKSLSGIHLGELSDVPGATKGYAGHDDFAVVEGVLARRFPIQGADGKPTGKMRQLQYHLKPGEAGWVLKVDRVTEF